MKMLIGSLFILLASQVANADSLVLKNGNELQGVVTEQNNKTVTIRIEGGEITIDASLVKTVNKGTETIQTIQDKETQSKENLLAANQARRERLIQYVTSIEDNAKAKSVAAAQPASFQRDSVMLNVAECQMEISEIADRIDMKIDLLRQAFDEINRSGFLNKSALRSAVLSELFPNYRAPLQVW